jgi:predicted membrane protein
MSGRWRHSLQPLLFSVIIAVLGWLMFLRATDTGSLWQWGVVFIALGAFVRYLLLAVCRPFIK